MESAGIHPVRVYINRRQKSISERATFLPVYVLCTEVVRMPVMIWMVHWWDQDALNEPES